MREPLDPELASMVAEIEAAGVPEWHAMSVAAARRVEDELFTEEGGPPVARIRDLAFDGPGGEVPVRVYRPEAEGPLPMLVYYHGGGWVLGTLDSVDPICRRLARRIGCLVVSVDYRLAPEHPFPAAVDDAYAALTWAHEQADALGGDPTRLGVAGTSAGGNLAAATGLRAGGDHSLRAQALLYPITDHDFRTESYRENADGPLLTRQDMIWFWEQYLRSPVDAHNPFASVLRADRDDLASTPPAEVVTAGHDPLRDEGVAYAERLADAGADVNHAHHPSMAHGFLSLTAAVTAADQALDDLAGSLQERLGVAD